METDGFSTRVTCLFLKTVDMCDGINLKLGLSERLIATLASNCSIKTFSKNLTLLFKFCQYYLRTPW